VEKPDYTVSVFYQEHENGNTNMRTFYFKDIGAARAFRMSCETFPTAWRPAKCYSYEIGMIHGPDVVIPRLDTGKWRAGMDSVRKALAACNGPLLGGLAKSVGIALPRRKDLDD
jgi:hypothetical protein